jgi:hypothetical protein
MQHLGAFLRGSVVPVPFNTRTLPGVPITFADSPTFRVLNAATLAEIEDGLVPDVDVDGVIGSHVLLVDTDDPAYDGVDELVIQAEAGEVDGVSVVGENFRQFTLTDGELPTDSISAAAVSAAAVTKLQLGLATQAALDIVDGIVDTLVARVTAARAGFWDNLNVGGLVASSAEATSIQNNTRVVRVVPMVLERPDAGTTVFRIELLSYDGVGNMEAPDSAPTLDVVNEGGTTRNANLDSVNGSLVSAGRYRWLYTIATAHALEQLLFTFLVVEGGVTRVFTNAALVVDTTAVDFTAADRVKLDALEARATEARLSELDTTAGKLAHDVASVLLTDRVTAARAAVLDDLINGGRLDLLIDATLAAAQAAPTAVQNADAMVGRHYRGGSNNAPTVADVYAGGLVKFSIDPGTNILTLLHDNGDVVGTRQLTRAAAHAIRSSLAVA